MLLRWLRKSNRWFRLGLGLFSACLLQYRACVTALSGGRVCALIVADPDGPNCLGRRHIAPMVTTTSLYHYCGAIVTVASDIFCSRAFFAIWKVRNFDDSGSDSRHNTPSRVAGPMRIATVGRQVMVVSSSLEMVWLARCSGSRTCLLRSASTPSVSGLFRTSVACESCA